MEHPQTSSTEPPIDLLFSLPPELLLIIFSFVGFRNFRRDIRRLTVSKKWYAYARPMLLSNLRLHSDYLQPMLCAMRECVTLAAAQQMTKHIELTLQAGSSFYESRADYLHPCTVLDLEELASALEDFAGLRTMVIRPMGALSKISSHTLPRFTVLRQLTSLVMDVPNMVFQSRPPHLCAAISELIPNLKRLRCRLPRICNDLLKSPPGDLEELIINICHKRLGHALPHHCSGHSFRTFDEYQTSLETRLVQFAASMRDPKIVRLIHTTPCDTYEKMYAFDAIENRRLLLGKSTAWDADGVVLPEDWQDPTQSEVELEWEKEAEEGEDGWGSDWSERDEIQDYGGYCDDVPDDDSESSDCGESDEE